MKRAVWITLGAAIVGGVAAALARDATSLEPGAARTLLLGLCVFMLFEWASHFLGSRLWGMGLARADRAAWAALSSAGIWIVLLALVPLLVRRLGTPPRGPVGLLLMGAAAASALVLRLWFLREIYEIEFDRAATLWAVSRGAAVLLACIAFVLYAFAGGGAGVGVPALSIAP